MFARANIEDIRMLLSFSYWQNEKYKNLLSSSILAKSSKLVSKLPILIALAEKYNINNYLNSSYLVLKSPSQNYALIRYILDNGYDLIVDEKLNSLFSYQPGALKKKFGIDLNELIAKYPFDENILIESEGVSLK